MTENENSYLELCHCNLANTERQLAAALRAEARDEKLIDALSALFLLDHYFVEAAGRRTTTFNASYEAS